MGGGNGSSGKSIASSSGRIGGGGSFGSCTSSSSLSSSNYDAKGTYLIFNAGDTLFISDFNSQDKVVRNRRYACWVFELNLMWGGLLLLFLLLQDPIKAIHFSNSNPVCHAFEPDAKDGHDLLIGLNSGDGR